MRKQTQVPAILVGLATAALVAACQTGTLPASQAPLPTVNATLSATLRAALTTPTPAATTAPSIASATPLMVPLPPMPSNIPIPSLSGSAQPTMPAIDPCALLTNDQVTAVNGVSYSAGVAHQMTPSSVECVWQSAADKASVTVQVAFWPSITDADAAYAEYVAAQDMAVEDVPGFGDKAAILRGSGRGLSTGGMYVRDGSVVFDVVYINGTPPSDGALQLAATLVLGHLPTM